MPNTAFMRRDPAFGAGCVNAAILLPGRAFPSTPCAQPNHDEHKFDA
jgi:hypothetical protein